MFGYVNCYTRIVCRKDDASHIEHANVLGTFVDEFTESCFEGYVNQIISRFIKEGWETVDIYPCTEEEYETGVEEDTDVIGYIDIYFRITAQKEEEKTVQYFNLNVDFAKFFDTGLLDSLEGTFKNFYHGNGFDIVDVATCTREEFKSCSSDDNKEFKLCMEEIED